MATTLSREVSVGAKLRRDSRRAIGMLDKLLGGADNAERAGHILADDAADIMEQCADLRATLLATFDPERFNMELDG